MRTKQQQEQTLLRRMCEAWSVKKEDATAEERYHNGMLKTYPKLEEVARRPYKAIKRVLYGRIVEQPLTN